MKQPRTSKRITASEAACFAYCPEPWRLEYGLGKPPGDQQARQAGTRYHRRLEAAERRAGVMLGGAADGHWRPLGAVAVAPVAFLVTTPALAALACLTLLIGVWLIKSGHAVRQGWGLSDGRTLSLDKIVLTSKRLGLTGRPDRIYRSGGAIVTEEWKSARAVQPWHRVQMGVYFLLAEERFGVHPSHGFLTTGDGQRHRIDNTPELRAKVLAIAEDIRRLRLAVTRPVAHAWPLPPGGGVRRRAVS